MEKEKFSYVDLILLFVTFIWGINPTIMKIGLKYIPPLPYNAARMVFSLIFSWAMVFILRKYKKIERQDVKGILFISIFGFFIFQMCFTAGVNLTTAGNASIILAIVPISVIIINKLFKIENIT